MDNSPITPVDGPVSTPASGEGPADHHGDFCRSERRLRALVIGAALGMIVAVAGPLVWRSNHRSARWSAYVGSLRSEPGIVVVQTGRRGGRWLIQGLRDPLAANPADRLAKFGLDPKQVIGEWQPYQSLAPELVTARLRPILDPPATVTLSLSNGTVVASGLAPLSWIEQARRLCRLYPGVTGLDTSRLEATDSAILQRWDDYIARLKAEPGITVIEQGFRDGKFYISGLCDPAASDPLALLDASGVSRDTVASDWKPYQAPVPELTRRREAMVLLSNGKAEPAAPTNAPQPDGLPPGSASNTAAVLPAASAPAPATNAPDGGPAATKPAAWDRFVERLKTEPGVCVVESGSKGGAFYLQGLRDPLSVDPEVLMHEFGIEPKSVTSRWEFYQASGSKFTILRAEILLAPPASVTLALEGDVLVARGAAAHQWIRDARLLSRIVPGVSELRVSDVQDTDLGELAVLKERVERQTVRFEPQAARLVAGQDPALNAVAESIRRLQEVCLKLDAESTIAVTGHAESESKGDVLLLCRSRADAVVDLLAARGVSRSMLAPAASDAAAGVPADVAAGARVTFRVRFLGLPE